MSSDHPHTAEGAISDSESQMLAKRLAKKKDECQYLRGLLHRLLKAQRRLREAQGDAEAHVDALGDYSTLKDEVHDALEGHPEYDARASEDGRDE